MTIKQAIELLVFSVVVLAAVAAVYYSLPQEDGLTYVNETSIPAAERAYLPTARALAVYTAGKTAHALGFDGEALALFNDARTLRPGWADADYFYAEATRWLGNTETAFEVIKNLACSSRTTVDVEEADVYIALGLIYIKKSQIEEKIKSGKRFYYAAQQCFERAVNAGGNSSFLFFQLGWACYQNIPPFDKAEAAYLEAIELDNVWGEGTSKADAYYNLAIISWNRGRKEEARERFEKVLELDPGNKRAQLYLDGLKKE